MIDAYLNDRKWVVKNGRCLLWTLAPAFGWLAMVFMGKKSGRQQMTNLGRIYGLVSLLGVFLTSVSSLLFQLAYNMYNATSAWSRMAMNVQEIGVYILVGMWFVCLIHTLICVKQYYQYLALKTMSAPASHELVQERKWCQEQLRWMNWCFFPVFGSLGLYLAGRKTNDRKLKRSGWMTTTILSLCYVISKIMGSDSYIWRHCVMDVVRATILVAAVLTVVAAFLVRDAYLEKWAQIWSRDTRQQPVLKDKGWCRRNCRWRLWTILPGLGGIGIMLAGNAARNRKITRKGLGMMVISIVLMLANAVLDARLGGLFYGVGYDLRVLLEQMLNTLHLVLWLAGLYYGTLIRWDVLKGRSKRLQGYTSEFQRDLDLYTRNIHTNQETNRVPEPVPYVPQPMQMPHNIQQAPVVQPPVIQAPIIQPPVVQPPVAQTPVVSMAESRMDINTCSLEELMTLPGVGIVQAKKAIAHRQEQGGFRNVDEFVQLLGLKPHFAVKVFELAEVSVHQSAAAHPSRMSDRGRRLDF